MVFRILLFCLQLPALLTMYLLQLPVLLTMHFFFTICAKKNLYSPQHQIIFLFPYTFLMCLYIQIQNLFIKIKLNVPFYFLKHFFAWYGYADDEQLNRTIADLNLIV